MITGIIDNTEFKFEWEQYPNTQATLCRVINQSQFDDYSRKEGAKISFEKVLKMLTKNQNKIDRKNFKKQAWELFFKREDTKPSNRLVAQE